MSERTISAEKTDWQTCPVCGGTLFEGGPLQIDGEFVWQKLDCHDCGTVWDEVYKALERNLYE